MIKAEIPGENEEGALLSTWGNLNNVVRNVVVSLQAHTILSLGILERNALCWLYLWEVMAELACVETSL